MREEVENGLDGMVINKSLKETEEWIKAVDLATAVVEEMLKQDPNSLQLPSTFPSTLNNGVKEAISICVFLGFDVDPALNIAARIRGPNDQYINHIMKVTGASVLLRGRSSGNSEISHWNEEQPLHLLLSSNNPKSLADAKVLADNLLDTISAECGTSRISAPKTCTTIPPPQNFQTASLNVGSICAPLVSVTGSNAALSSCTSYSGYGGIYPQATPLQQVALALRHSHAAASSETVTTQPTFSSPPQKVKQPQQRRMFQELQALSMEAANSHQPKIQDELIAREIIINDAESSVRYKLTKRQFQEEIQQCTGAVVITRGKYRAPNVPSTGEKPLYLHISAGSHLKETAERIKAVDLAAVAVEEMLNQDPNSLQLPSAFRSTLNNGVKEALSICVFLGFDVDPALNIAARIRGPNDQYINHIMNVTGATVLLRGRSSGNSEISYGNEEQPLHLLLSSNNPKSLADAKLLADNLLDTISAECGASRISAPKAYTTMPPPQNFQTASLNVGSICAPLVSVTGSNTVLSSCTSYSGYGGIYPQATPLQQVALALRHSHAAVSPETVATQPNFSSPPQKLKQPQQRRKFQELQAVSMEAANFHQGISNRSDSSPRNISTMPPPKKLVRPSNSGIMPPPLPKKPDSLINASDTLIKLVEYDEEDDEEDDEDLKRKINTSKPFWAV